MQNIQFEKLIAIVPLSRTDPDPSELTEPVAEATLGSYQALWHPALLSRSSSLPAYARAAEPPDPAPGQLILLPEVSRRFIASDWESRAEGTGARLVAGGQTRGEFLVRLCEAVGQEMGLPMDQAGTERFLALGLGRLWLEMLTAYMKHMSTLNEEHFQKEVLAAASAAVVGDYPSRDDHLRAAFQLLSEARQSLYPVDVQLLDLCLVDPRAGMDRLEDQLVWGLPVNVFMSGRTAEVLRDRHPALAERMRVALEEGRGELIGGEFEEVASTLLPLESHLWQFRRGERSYRDVFARSPQVHGRRRFGLAPYVLQLLNRMEIHWATHFSFDDGTYPAASDVKVRWEAPDSSTVEALARIPIAADNALEFLKFPHQLARTIMGDHVATLPLVHWPMPQCPWYADLLRMTQYANVFGRFSTLSNYFQTTDPPPISTRPAGDEFVSPVLVSAHEQRATRPISEFAEHHRLRARFEAVRWLFTVGHLLSGSAAVQGASVIAPVDLDRLEAEVESGDHLVSERLVASGQQLGQAFASFISPPRPDGEPGVLVFNSLGFDRQVLVPLNSDSMQGGSGPDDGPAWVSVDVPGMGFAWVSEKSQPPPAPTEPAGASAEGQILRNEHLEVQIDGSTGGIWSISDRLTGNRLLGQQLALCGIRGESRGPYGSPAGTYDTSTTGSEPVSCKSQMRATAMDVRSKGPDIAEIVVEGELLAVPCPSWAADPCMARFRQRYRLERGQPLIRVSVEIIQLKDGALDPHASPWECYLASRFAWPDPGVLLVRGVGSSTESSRTQRPETPHFIELHGRRHRTAILTGGLPFHQRSGDRMLDTLLVTAGETVREFEFAIGVDLPNPFQTALDLITPPVMIACQSGPPVSGPSGWFFHLDARNVVITSVSPLGPDQCGVRVRMFESAGRYTRAQLRCLRDVTSARMTDFHGQRLLTLEPQGDAVPLDLSPHEIAQLEIEFQAPATGPAPVV